MPFISTSGTVSPVEMTKFTEQYYGTFISKTQRFGQAFLNHFGFPYPHLMGGDCLFGENDNKKAEQVCWEMFVGE